MPNVLSYFNPWRAGSNFFHDLKNAFSVNDHYEQDKSSESKSVNAYVQKLMHSSDFIAATVFAYEDGVCPKQANVQSRTLDDEFNKTFEYYIKKWSKSGMCDITERYYRGDAERAMTREYAALSGGYIKAHHFSKAYQYGYKFELIPLSAVDESYSDFDKGEFHGIRVSKKDRAITAIRIFTDHTRQKSEWRDYKDLTLVVKRWASMEQYNGVAPVAPALKGLKYTKEYEDEEMRGARKRASNNVFVRTPFLADMWQKAKSILNGKENNATKLKEVFDSQKLQNDVYGVQYISKDEEVTELGKGIDNPYADIYRNKTRALSAAVRLSPMLTIGEMPSSYNAMLYFSQKDERVFASTFEQLVANDWEDTLYRLLDGLVMKGLMSPKNYWSNKEQYQALEFMRQGLGHIDPIKEQKATSEGLANGSLNPMEVQSKRGVDYEAHIQASIDYELKRKELYEKAGLKYVQTGFESTLTPEDLLNEDDEK